MGPLSVDLRTRVVAAVCEEGMSCRAAARCRQRNVTRVASFLPWAKPARAAGMRVARSIWFVPIAARESASGVITSTRLPFFTA